MSLKKRTIALCMSIILVCCVLPFNVFAVEESLSSAVLEKDEHGIEENEGENVAQGIQQEMNDNSNDVSTLDYNAEHESLGEEPDAECEDSGAELATYATLRNRHGLVGDNAGDATRDIVLVLDNSISMEGIPLVNLKESAIKFCTSVLQAKGINRVSIVAYDTDISVATEFTNNIDTLSMAINSMDGQGSWTNITAGVQKADELLQASVASIKNIVVMTDGVPTAGLYSASGPYTFEDYSGNHSASHYVFEYSNALYENMTALFDQYNIYTLGFFHNIRENVKVFASRVLNDTQNAGYYEVTNPDDLEFTFGEVADDMTQEQLKNLYVDQHIAYYKNNYKEEIQEMILPDGDGNAYRNTNYLLENIVLDAAKDNVSKNYNVASVITDSLNLNFDFVDGAVSNYEIILADIVTSSYYKDVLKEAYTISAMDNTKILLQGILEYGFEHLNTMAENSKVSVDALRQEWQTLAEMLDQMKICENPDKFASLYGKCSVVVDKYMKADDQMKFLNSLNGKKGYRGEAIGAVTGAVLGATIDTATEMMTYYSCYDAYCSASDTYKEILVLIGVYANSTVQTGADGKPIYIGGLDEIFYCQSLSVAIKNFLDNASENATGAQALAEKFAKEGIKNFGNAFAEAGVDTLLNHIPIVGKLNKIRKTAGLGAAGSMFLVDCATKIDNRAYAASMIYQLYFLTNCTVRATDDLGRVLANETDSEEAFEWAYRFDEAVRIWRCCSIMLCDLGVEFEGYCLQDAQKNIKPWTNSAIEDASWYSTAISIAALEKKLISDIHCHDINLSYDPSSGVIDWHQNGQVVLIACPVAVCVTNENDKKIAVLEDNTQTIEVGYEPYFHVLETQPGSNDYMKICYIPNGWNIRFNGTGDGSMYVVKANIVDGKIQNPIKSPEISISKEIEGHISFDNDENFVVIDNDENFAVINNVDIYTITFNANGGRINGASTMKTNMKGKLASLPVNPVHDSGYTFKGWYTAKEGGIKITLEYVFKEDTTVYAQWMKEDSSGNGSNISENESGSRNVTNSSSVTSDPGKNPHTGDVSNLKLCFGLLLVATIGIVISVRSRKKDIYNSL